jgi:hypothetical protein
MDSSPEEIAMQRFLTLAAAALVVAACATLDSDQQLARADCKVAPLTLASSTGNRPRRVDPLEQRYAEMQLATSEYRWARSNQALGAFNTVEEALRDCAAAR